MDNNVDNVNTATTIHNLEPATTSSSAVETAQLTKQPQPKTTTNSFWKNSNRIVPGRPSPKRINPIGLAGEVGRGGIGMMANFRDYQNSVSDAWDTGDDEFCIISDAATQQQQQLHALHKGSEEGALIHKTGN